MAWAEAIQPAIGAVTGIIGGIKQRNAIKRAGTTLADQANVNAKRLLETGDRSADAILSSTDTAARGVRDAGDRGMTTISDNLNRGISRVDTSLADLKPYMDVGTQGTEAIGRGFQDDGGGLKFLLDQGSRGILNNAATRGMIGGNTGRALTEFGQGTAQQYKSNWLADELKKVAVGRGAVDRNIAGNEGIADDLNQAARDSSNLDYRAAGDEGDYRVGGTSSANTLRTNAMNGAVGQWTDAAEATAGSQMGSASAFAQMLANITGSATSLGGGLADWLKARRAGRGGLDVGAGGGEAAVFG